MLVRRKYAFELIEKLGNGLNIRLKLDEVSGELSSVVVPINPTQCPALWFFLDIGWLILVRVGINRYYRQIVGIFFTIGGLQH